MKLSVSAYRAQASAHKKILDTAYQLNYGSTSAASHPHPASSSASGAPTCSGFQQYRIMSWFLNYMLVIQNTSIMHMNCSDFKNDVALGVNKTSPIGNSVLWSYDITRPYFEVKSFEVKYKMRYLCRGMLPPQMDEYILANLDLEQIEDGSFPKGHRYVVDLQNNKLKEIKNGAFSNTTIQALNLQNNTIEKIEEDAFKNMPFLKVVLLSHNNLKVWNSNWFSQNPSLKEVFVNKNPIVDRQYPLISNSECYGMKTSLLSVICIADNQRTVVVF